MKQFDTKICSKLLKDLLVMEKHSILTNKDEFGGKIETYLKFDKNNKKYYNDTANLEFKKGYGCKSVIPNAKINFHTHPVECYLNQEAIWGWPSGGDMLMLLNMKEFNLVHLVFSLEGTYIIKVNPLARKLLNPKEKEEIGYNFIKTHKYRSFDNYSKHHTYFKKEFPFLKRFNSKNTLNLWLKLANNQYFLHNDNYHRIFKITFVKNKTFQDTKSLNKTWNTLKILNNKNISNYVKIEKTIFFNCEF